MTTLGAVIFAQLDNIRVGMDSSGWSDPGNAYYDRLYSRLAQPDLLTCVFRDTHAIGDYMEGYRALFWALANGKLDLTNDYHAYSIQICSPTPEIAFGVANCLHDCFEDACHATRRGGYGESWGEIFAHTLMNELQPSRELRPIRPWADPPAEQPQSIRPSAARAGAPPPPQIFEWVDEEWVDRQLRGKQRELIGELESMGFSNRCTEVVRGLGCLSVEEAFDALDACGLLWL